MYVEFIFVLLRISISLVHLGLNYAVTDTL